jgi:hypothetical protein
MMQSDLPLYVVPVIIGHRITLRIYRGDNLTAEIPLRRRQALVLGAQLINVGLIPEYEPADQRVPDARAQ